MSIQRPYFSVVIPLYNKGPHVERSISSIFNQTFSDYELIVINDASTDNSVEEVLRFNDERIRLLHRSKPGAGGYAARNLGIKNASGLWIAFLDADDEWLPNHLEKMHILTLEYPGVYFLCCGWLTNDGQQVTENNYFRQNKKSGNKKINFREYVVSCRKDMRPVWTSVACVNKISPNADHLFPENVNMKRGGDLHAWLKLMCYHKVMAWSDHIGAIYHKDSINMVTKYARSSPIEDRINLIKDFRKYLNSKEKIYLRKYINHTIRVYIINNLKENKISTNVLPRIFIIGDLGYAIINIVLIMLPPSLFRLLLRLRRALKEGGILRVPVLAFILTWIKQQNERGSQN